MRRDPVWSTAGCVFVASLLAEMFESPQRRIQYSLYMMTQIMRMMANAVVLKYGEGVEAQRRMKWLSEWWSLIVFQVTFAIWNVIKLSGDELRFCTKWSVSAMNVVF